MVFHSGDNSVLVANTAEDGWTVIATFSDVNATQLAAMIENETILGPVPIYGVATGFQSATTCWSEAAPREGGSATSLSALSCRKQHAVCAYGFSSLRCRITFVTIEVICGISSSRNGIGRHMSMTMTPSRHAVGSVEIGGGGGNPFDDRAAELLRDRGAAMSKRRACRPRSPAGATGAPWPRSSGDAHRRRDPAHHAHADREEKQRVAQRRRADRGDAEGTQHRGADMLSARASSGSSRCATGSRPAARPVVRLHLALEDFDRGLGLAFPRHHRQDVGDRSCAPAAE